jgi:hypothetical protein
MVRVGKEERGRGVMVGWSNVSSGRGIRENRGKEIAVQKPYTKGRSGIKGYDRRETVSLYIISSTFYTGNKYLS